MMNTGTLLRLANHISCPATSCTWLMLPGAEVSCSV